MDMSQQKTARMLSMNNNLVCKRFQSLEDVCSLDIDNPFVPFGGAAVIKCNESKFNHGAKVKRIMRPVSFSRINTKVETFLFSLIACKFSGFWIVPTTAKITAIFPITRKCTEHNEGLDLAIFG